MKATTTRDASSKAVRPNIRQPNVPSLNLGATTANVGRSSKSRPNTTKTGHMPTSPSQLGGKNAAENRGEPNFGVSMLSGGDASDNKTADFFSASRSNHDLKDMLRSARETAKNERQELQNSQTELYNFTERTGKGNELRLVQKKPSGAAE